VNDPSFGETFLGGDVLGQIVQYLNYFVTIAEGNRIDSLVNEMASQLPLGEGYTAVIFNPSGFGGQESVSIVRGPDPDGPYWAASGDRTFVKNFYGTKNDYSTGAPSTVSYTSPSGQPSQARVRDPGRFPTVPSLPTAAPLSGGEPNVIDYEPDGSVFGNNPYVPQQINPGEPGYNWEAPSSPTGTGGEGSDTTLRYTYP
jgi:hypothetical protein